MTTTAIETRPSNRGVTMPGTTQLTAAPVSRVGTGISTTAPRRSWAPPSGGAATGWMGVSNRLDPQRSARTATTLVMLVPAYQPDGRLPELFRTLRCSL